MELPGNNMKDKYVAKQETELSLRDIVLKLRATNTLLKKRWRVICLWGILGGLAGLGYASLKKNVYTATCTFVLEENKSSGLSQYAGIASMAGISLGGGESGIFEGDNIIELYRSRAMITKTLLSEINIGGKSFLLIDRYIDFQKLRKKWEDNDQLHNITFIAAKGGLSRQQDSLLTSVVTDINKRILTVSRPDKKLNIIAVSVGFGDELFAREFNDRLVATVNDFYIRTKTKKTAHNVEVLQRQADSVRTVLNNSLSGVASALDAAPNANPLLLSLRVPSQRKQIDVQSSSAIYAEIVKNLELSKISLRQETPLIQVIDQPVLPLPVEKTGKVKLFLEGFFLLLLMSAVYIFFKSMYQNIMKEI